MTVDLQQNKLGGLKIWHQNFLSWIEVEQAWAQARRPRPSNLALGWRLDDPNYLKNLEFGFGQSLGSK